MSDTLRRTSEQYATKLEAIDRNISDAEANIKNWKREREEVVAAKDLIDKALSKAPATKPASPA